MKRWNMAVAAFMTGLLCWMPVMQPVVAYAESAGLVAESDGGTSDEAGSVGSANDSEVGATGADDSDEASSADVSQDAVVNNAADASEAQPQAEQPAEDDTVATGDFAGNSFRYDNGDLRADLEDDGIALFSARRPDNATGWGVDVSNHQGYIDWARVKAAGVDFAILRCGWGTGGTDASFAANVRGCKQNGIRFGVYLYSYGWDASTGADEGNWTVNLLRSNGVSPSDLALPVYYDLENEHNGRPAGAGSNGYHYPSNADLAAQASAFCSTVQSAGYTAGVYASLNWWINYLNSGVFNNWHRWVAQYNVTCDYTGSYSMWQYSSKGAVDGINGNVDVNYWLSDVDTNWVKEGDKWFYKKSDGSNYIGELQSLGKWYYLDPEDGGAMATGFTALPAGKTVYYGSDGAMRYGEQKVDGKWYFFDQVTGAMATGLTDLPAGKTVLYGEDGAMLYGPQDVPGVGRRFFDDVTGALKSAGWIALDGRWYYLDGSGEIESGEVKDGGKWYYLDPEDGGAMGTGFTALPAGKTVYYGPDGAMRYGEQKVDGKWYFFDQVTGAMATGLTDLPAGKTVLYGEDGAMLYGPQDVPGVGKCYFDEFDGHLVTDQWISIDSSGVLHWANHQGALSSITSKLDEGGYRFFDSKGNLLTGWIDVGDSRFYALPTTGYMAVGEQQIDGQWYYFYDSGEMARTQFVLLSDAYAAGGQKWVYYNDDGVMLHGEQKINGGWYYLDERGAVTYGWKYLSQGNKWVWYGPFMGDGRMRYGAQVIDGVQRYFDTVSGACDKIGYQNPASYYQVSTRNVSLPSYAGGGIFSYVTPSRISVDATRSQLVETMIARAYDYLGSPYVWNYSCAPGVGVDCAGLVMQALYATGMDLSPMNPWDHYYTPGHDQYANYMWENGRFKHVSLNERQRGDLICYPGHIAIYLGNDQIIEAGSPSVGVRVHSMYVGLSIRGVLRPFV